MKKGHCLVYLFSNVFWSSLYLMPKMEKVCSFNRACNKIFFFTWVVYCTKTMWNRGCLSLCPTVSLSIRFVKIYTFDFLTFCIWPGVHNSKLMEPYLGNLCLGKKGLIIELYRFFKNLIIWIFEFLRYDRRWKFF